MISKEEARKKLWERWKNMSDKEIEKVLNLMYNVWRFLYYENDKDD